MSPVVVEAQERSEFGKNASRRLRARGSIPAVLYGHGSQNVSIAVDPKKVVEILTSETGRNTIFKLDVNGRFEDVLIREYQLHPVKGTLLHVDFQRVAMDEVMEFEVPVEVVGTAPGVKAGGILDVVLRELTVECLPSEVPDHIQVDVSNLEIGGMVRVSDLQVDTSKIKVLNDPHLVVLVVTAPRVEEEAPAAAAEAPAEPEVIRRGKVEAEEEGE